MYTKLDEDMISMLCCPLCKGNLLRAKRHFACRSCGLVFPGRRIRVGQNSDEEIFDFRIDRPRYCMPEGHRLWLDSQSEFEEYDNRVATRDSLQEYLDEIESVREIYTDEYHIAGKVLDVGGHQGRLRHYLGDDVTLYVSADPYINIFQDVEVMPNLTQAYPCLSEPCNFLAAHAEYLPFRARSFDWIHMRSVVDHFADPYLAFLEAFRCCKTGGNLLVGLNIIEKKQLLDRAGANTQRCSLPGRVAAKLKREGLQGLAGAICARLSMQSRKDDHIFRLTHANLIDLFERTGWEVVKEHWQKPPFAFCIYICGEARDPL